MFPPSTALCSHTRRVCVSDGIANESLFPQIAERHAKIYSKASKSGSLVTDTGDQDRVTESDNHKKSLPEWDNHKKPLSESKWIKAVMGEGRNLLGAAQASKGFF